jgi:rubrerythrin
LSNPKKPTDLGPNRTGAGTSPIDTARTAEGAQKLSPDMQDGALFEQTRLQFSTQAPPVGSMPPPATMKGIAKTAVNILKGNKPTVLLDKLGERLAFERTGARLYDALIVKFQASSTHSGATRELLDAIRTDELRHVGLLIESFERLGADPTAMTPCADVTAVASMGIIQVLTDPRTTFTQCLDAVLIAELADTDGWTMLADLCEAIGQNELATQFRTAEEEEQRHVTLVREWLASALIGQARQEPTAGVQPSAPPP